jgi:hypothetical protein
MVSDENAVSDGHGQDSPTETSSAHARTQGQSADSRNRVAISSYRDRDKYIRSVLAEQSLGAAEKVVLIRLAYHVNCKTGRCYPAAAKVRRKRGISHSEFARRAGCSTQFVEAKIAAGYLVEYPDGTLDAGLVDTDWRGRGREGPRQPAVIEIRDGETAKQAAERIIKEGNAPWSRPEAERIRINYQALIARLEYEQAKGKLVDVEEVAKGWAYLIATVRARLLAIPAKIAVRVRVCKNEVEAQALVKREIEGAMLILSNLNFEAGNDENTSTPEA